MDTSKKSIYVAAAVSLALIAIVVYFLFVRQTNPKSIKLQDLQFDQKQITDIELAKRPYVVLAPNSTGTEIEVSIQNMNYFDSIDYEITYMSDNPQVAGEKIQRGATGSDINTKDEKSIKSAPLGTGSKGVFSADKNISDGKLTLHLQKGDTEYVSETNWDLFEAGQKGIQLSNRTGNFTFKIPALRKDYWIIIADTVGLPPGYDFDSSAVTLPIYGIFSLDTKFPSNADVSIKVDPGQEPQLYKFKRIDSNWAQVDDAILNKSAGTISASIDAYATFVIVSSK